LPPRAIPLSRRRRSGGRGGGGGGDPGPRGRRADEGPAPRAPRGGQGSPRPSPGCAGRSGAPGNEKRDRCGLRNPAGPGPRLFLPKGLSYASPHLMFPCRERPAPRLDPYGQALDPDLLAALQSRSPVPSGRGGGGCRAGGEWDLGGKDCPTPQGREQMGFLWQPSLLMGGYWPRFCSQEALYTEEFF